MDTTNNIPQKFVRLAALCCVLFASLVQANTNCTDTLLTVSLQSAFPGWHIVDLKDLRQDDQGLWVKQHPSECPGLVQGNFESGKKQSFVMTVFKGSNGDLQQMLLAAKLSTGTSKYRLSVLDGPRKVAYLSVISKVPPGEYSDASGSKLKTHGDSILYEAIEAGSMLFYFQNGKFKSETLSE